MSFTVPTAFAGAELEYRQERVKAEYAAHSSRPQRRIRLVALFQPRRRPNPVSPRPLPAPHH